MNMNTIFRRVLYCTQNLSTRFYVDLAISLACTRVVKKCKIEKSIFPILSIQFLFSII